MTHRGSWAGLGVLLSLAVAAGAAGDDVYVGTVAIAGAASGAQPTSVPLTLTIREYTSDDRVLQLATLLHDKGHAAAVADLAKGEAGTLRIGEGSFRASTIRLEKTATGRLLRIVTDRPMHGAGAPSTAPGEAVGYLELQLGPEGGGSGRLLPAVKITFDAEGFLAPENLGATWPVSNVKPGQ
jgi:hypothetical protein